MKTKQQFILFTFAAALLLTVSSQAQTVRNWTSTTSGDFFTPANWDGGVVPAATDTAVINNGTTATLGGTGTNELGRIILGALNDGADQGTTESGHIIMNSGFLRLGGTAGDGKAVIGLSETLSTFIMNGGTIWFDGPEMFPGSTGDDGLNGLDLEVGERGLGRFEVHSNAVFRAGDDIKIAENAAGNGSCLIDGNAKVSVGSGISISGGASTNQQTMVIAGNAVVDSGNSLGAGDPGGSTDEGYLTMATGEGVAHLTIQDNATLNIRRLTARQGTSTIIVKNNGQFHIFDVLRGKGNTVNPPDRPAETGPGSDNNNSTYPSQPSTATLTLQDDAQMTVNAATGGHLQGLAISGPRADADPGGTGLLIVRDRASFRVEQDLGLGVGRDGDGSDGFLSDGTLEVVGPNAQVSIGTNLNMAVNSDGTIAARVDGSPATVPGNATLSAVITGSTHSTVNVGGTAYIGQGILKVTLQGYTPVGGETYTVIQGGTINGQFRETNYTAAPLAAGLSWTLEYATNAVRLRVTGQTAAPRIVTVTTTNNVSPPAGTVSLLQAITGLQAGDIIRFNIPGAGPHAIETPTGGYPLITQDNVTIDGSSQPGSIPNTNPILSSNNAQIKIVLDSRNGNSRLMDFAPTSPNDQTGYGDTESAVIGILEATNVTISGVSILAVPLTGSEGDIALYGVSFAKAASGHVKGCWIGIAPDRTTVAGPADGVTGFRYRVRDESDTVLEDILIQNVTVGVAKGSTNARSEFNVFTGIPAIPIIIEGSNLRISGNFLNVWPSGLVDYNPPRDFPNLPDEAFGGNIEIGRGDNNVVIGVDGDGVNDADERNVLSGVLPPSMNGYDHIIEFYGATPATNVVIAGNYIGVGVDGTTYFTNGVPAVNAAGGSPQYRIGSDFNGVSDALEGNLIVNNYPSSLFPASGFTDIPGDLDFFDELNPNAIVSLRGNSLINNFPAPVSPLKTDGQFLLDYMAKAVADTNNGIIPVLATNTSAVLLAGAVPIASSNFPVTVIDLYIADPVGITNGQAANIPGLTNGFVQGRTYLGSFVEGSPTDLNTNAGAFEFNITSLNVANGTTITVTANYLQEPAGATNGVALTSPFSDPATVSGASPAPSVSVSRQGGQISIQFTGTLESAPSVVGPWTPVPGNPTSPYSVPPADATGTRFYRSTTP